MAVILMTKTRTILGISFAAVFALSMIMVPAYAAGHLIIEKTDVKVKNFATLDVKITTTGKIPKDSSTPFGYGIFTNGFEKVLALTSHGVGIEDHPDQDGPFDPVFHSHILDLMDARPSCPSGTVEVDWENTLDNNISPEYKVKVKKDKISVKAPIDSLDDAGVEFILAFTIEGGPEGYVVDAETTLPQLCLTVTSGLP
jgi:hypothetical protein